MLDPRNEFNVDRTLTKEDVQKLIKVLVVQLVNYLFLNDVRSITSLQKIDTGKAAI